MSKVKKSILFILFGITIMFAGLTAIQALVNYAIRSRVEDLYIAIACLIIFIFVSVLTAVLGDIS